MKTVHTYKELNDIAGTWTTNQIRNDYVKGGRSFTITYQGQSVTFESENLTEVASCACSYNGLRWSEFLQFRPDNYIKSSTDKREEL